MNRTPEKWSALRWKLSVLVERQGAQRVASRIPVARATLWRWLRAETLMPARAQFDSVARIVAPIGSRSRRRH